jgi:two-component sensor histidine kinase/CheY-like chemotaxis protein
MSPERDGAPTRVLYVDDGKSLARLIQKALGRQGFTVELASSADVALEMIASQPFDVVALDHYLPSGTGLDLLSRLADLTGTPPVVYVTGSSELHVGVAALKAGASDFISKTVGDDFLTLLGSALSQAIAKAQLLTAKEAAEAEVRMARDRAEMLLAEVNHRVGNSLTLVSSLVSMQSSLLTDQVAKDALAETRARIFAIASVHKSLYSSTDVRYVDLSEYLDGLLQNLGLSMQAAGSGTRLVIDLESIRLATDASISLGIVVTELVTNAFKYAYPESDGEIHVRLRPLGDSSAELTVEDAGIGRQAAAKGTGLGTRIINAMAATMNADMEYVDRTPGTAARLTFPLRH